jgi:hypothetical protein
LEIRVFTFYLDLRTTKTNSCILFTVDFVLTEAVYTVVQIIRRFQTIKLPEGIAVELTGVEKQTATLVVSITEGCKVELQ